MSEASLRDVFISYSATDSAIVTPIAQRLKHENLSRFFAPTEIRAGDNFIGEIGLGLQQAHTMVVFVSPASLRSFWVEREWGAYLVKMARDRTARLLPVLLPGVDERQIHPFLQVEHRIDCRTLDLADPDTLEQVASSIVAGVRGGQPDVETIGLPFVVVAMTRDEARRLESGETFDDPAVAPIERQVFADVLEELRRHGMQELAASYGEGRDAWRPPIAGDVSARQTIEDMVAILNRERRQHAGTVLRPQFFSDDFLSDERVWAGRIWSRLAELGCVMLVDTVSLFHPGLREKLRSSELGSNQRASLVFVSPLDPHQLSLPLLVEQHIRTHLPRAYDRFEVEFDALCEVGAGGVRQLKRWLFTVLPAMAETVQRQRALPERREAMRAEVGEPSGIGRQLIFGRGPR